MNQFLIVLLLLTVSLQQGCDATTATQLFQADQPTSVSGKILKELPCSKDAQIDFDLPQGTVANLPITQVVSGATTYQYVRFVRLQMI